jgi:cytochrome c-type biogenesis protein CcmF
MQEIQYIGERLWAGTAGHSLIILSLTSALLACISYIMAEQKNSDITWKQLGRTAFRLHSISALAAIAVLFFMLINQYFEYQYVWQHSNSEMPIKYIFASFWEGQEGSFLLWIFWHVVLGNILMHTSKKWEAPVMAVFASVQVFLLSMVLGVYIGDVMIGTSPFTSLLREVPDFAAMPLFTNPNYLDNLDGRGLNPLLMNYWMTIHPPTLFFGFASTLVPFSYAIAGLWRMDFNGWTKPAIPWAYVGIAVLGTGILMGGAWAYEALSFGGFWAWDPVENASLVPWITLVGGAHIMLIQRNRGSSLFMAFFLILISFILVLYSTFLTRSGILGEASVHSFTDLGMSGQLLLYLLSYLVLSLVLLIFRYNKMPKSPDEEALLSREFWMFTGALVLMISAFQISFSTSIPVINKVFGTNMAPPVDVIDHYHAWQVPFSIILLLIMGFALFLKYKKTDAKLLFKQVFRALAVALFLTMLIGLSLQFNNPFYLALLFASLFTFFSNMDYIIQILKGKINKGGSALAHAGFGLLLLGALISTGKSKVISQNHLSIDITSLGDEFKNNENILLMKDDTLVMGEYYVSYKGKRKEGINVFFDVDYLTKTGENTFEKAFSLSPYVQTNARMGNVAEPSTKHFLYKDIFTHVTYAELEERQKGNDEFKNIETKSLKVGDTLFANAAILILDRINPKATAEGLSLKESDIAVAAEFTVYDFNLNTYILKPLYLLLDSNRVYNVSDEIDVLGVKLSFDKINPEDGSIEVSLFERKNKQDFIIMKAIVFPFINLLWAGCILMVIGIFIAVWNRIKLQKSL